MSKSKPLTGFAKFMKDHKGLGMSMSQLASKYRNEELISMPVLSSTCSGLNKEECAPPCHYISTAKRQYCKLKPEPLSAQKKEASKLAAAATRSQNYSKRNISQQEHERRSLSALMAAAKTRAKRRAAGLPQRL